MGYADPTRVRDHIVDIMNAAATYGGAIAAGIRSDAAVTQARVESGTEILRAVAANPRNGFFPSLATLVTVAHNAFLPAHDGEPGIPVIVPFNGGGGVDGTPATPAEIDSYRADPTTSIYTGANDGVKVAHNAADANGMASPIACRYSIVNGRLKFTGFSAQVPLIQLTRTMADTGVPDSYEPTLVKLAIPKLVKPGDQLYTIAQVYAQAGMADLAMIMSGEMRVPPVPAVELAQKGGVV